MSRIVIFGAGGRAGRTITAEARSRGHQVTAVVRDPDRYPELGADGVRVVAGNVTDAGAVAAISGGHDAAVEAVSPFSGPEQGFDDLDSEFFVKAAAALLSGLPEAGVSRLVAIGLFSTLATPGGGLVMDDPEAHPPEFRPFAERLRPFAAAHAAGLYRLREADTTVDWVMLTPPARLEADGARTGGYRIGGETAPPPESRLSYADLAVAAIDEIETPRHHRTRVSVFGES
ncbi:NAD(P)-dependent oxidoreductase [Actinoallomurus soli]|uniref:NAD(P)-dependent oxidoreductase n=1 Tax=Actinoallomurus soli TaxID=2952535 RepID=UPI002092A9AA|nr:NAD(P)H-binding protein [Actinoallomurus soli]MCO5973292.1 NAD(P)H-binding protein [Actinoallomurus soli]